MAEQPETQQAEPGSTVPDSSVFVIKLTRGTGDAREVIGYAIAEQTGFVDIAQRHAEGLVGDESGLIREHIGNLFEGLAKQGRLFEAMAIPGEKDRNGGFVMLTSAGSRTSALNRGPDTA